MGRAWPAPLEGNTLHFVGDLHFGVAKHSFAMDFRNEKLRDDLLTSRVLPPSVAAHVMVGDYTEASTTGQFTTANTWTNTISGAWYGVPGNHDLWGVRSSSSAMGLATAWDKNTTLWTEDLGFCRLIGLGLSDYVPLRVDQSALDFLNSTLSSTARDCIVLCHGPLAGTVLADDEALEYTSRVGASPEMYMMYEAGVTTTIEEILEAQPNAKLYVSGHTHPRVTAPNVVKDHDLGARNILTLNCPAPIYTNKLATVGSDPIHSIYVTFKTTGFGDVIEFRVRDHGGRCWGSFDNGEKLITHTVPA